MLPRGTKELLHRKEIEFDHLLLFSGVAGPGKFYVFLIRLANVNLTQLDQNDLPRILLNWFLPEKRILHNSLPTEPDLAI